MALQIVERAIYGPVSQAVANVLATSLPSPFLDVGNDAPEALQLRQVNGNGLVARSDLASDLARGHGLSALKDPEDCHPKRVYAEEFDHVFGPFGDGKLGLDILWHSSILLDGEDHSSK